MIDDLVQTQVARHLRRRPGRSASSRSCPRSPVRRGADGRRSGRFGCARAVDRGLARRGQTRYARRARRRSRTGPADHGSPRPAHPSQRIRRRPPLGREGAELGLQRGSDHAVAAERLARVTGLAGLRLEGLDGLHQIPRTDQSLGQRCLPAAADGGAQRRVKPCARQRAVRRRPRVLVGIATVQNSRSVRPSAASISPSSSMPKRLATAASSRSSPTSSRSSRSARARIIATSQPAHDPPQKRRAGARRDGPATSEGIFRRSRSSPTPGACWGWHHQVRRGRCVRRTSCASV